MLDDPTSDLDHEDMVLEKRVKDLRLELLQEYAKEHNCDAMVLEIIALAAADDCYLALEFLDDRYTELEIAALVEDFERFGIAWEEN